MILFIANPTELVGAKPLHLACARPLCRLKAPLGLSLLRNRGILISEENKKSEPFSYREKVRIFYFSGSPPGRHSYGLGTAHEQKPHRRWGRAVQVLLSAVIAKGKMPYKTKKTATKSCLPCGAVKQSKSEPFPFDAASAASPKVTVCVPSL